MPRRVERKRIRGRRTRTKEREVVEIKLGSAEVVVAKVAAGYRSSSRGEMGGDRGSSRGGGRRLVVVFMRGEGAGQETSSHIVGVVGMRK